MRIFTLGVSQLGTAVLTAWEAATLRRTIHR